MNNPSSVRKYSGLLNSKLITCMHVYRNSLLAFLASKTFSGKKAPIIVELIQVHLHVRLFQAVGKLN